MIIKACGLKSPKICMQSDNDLRFRKRCMKILINIKNLKTRKETGIDIKCIN